MLCPSCNSKMLIKDSRTKEQEVYRRRVCSCCGEVVYTVEKIDNDSKYVLSAIHKTVKER